MQASSGATIGAMTSLPLPALILASSSVYRKQLLERLRYPFLAISPEVDETPLNAETPANLALRLALAKAVAIANHYPDAVVIGSDQVADLNGVPLGKPGNHASAVVQLTQMSGKTVLFQTALAVVCLKTGFAKQDLATVRVTFKPLRAAQIENYLRAETPYDCAGSAKSEGLGITLIDRIDSDDPTALIGLPLIRTCQLITHAGIDLLGLER
jgi:septum formation protein